MTTRPANNPLTIFEGGRLRPGIYKIQNLYHPNYLDIQEHSRQLFCRPARDLEDGKGLWEIRSFGAGYTIRRVEPGKPDQFCNPMEGLDDGTALYVAAYPVAWRIELVDDDAHRGFEYARIYWGTTKRAWDLSFTTGAEVNIWMDKEPVHSRIWKMIPVEVEDFPPLYDPTERPPAHAQRAGLERDEFGTIVNEVTVLNTTVTTHKRYRVEDA